MIMKTEEKDFWALRVLNSLTGEVEYHVYAYLTVAEIEHKAATFVSNNRDLYVSIFKFHKMY